MVKSRPRKVDVCTKTFSWPLICTVKGQISQTKHVVINSSRIACTCILDGPDSVSITPNQNGLIHIVEDTATSIQCSWQDCHPTSMCNLTWWKSDTKKHAQKGVPSLSLFDSNYNVKRTDAGSYRCEAARADNVIADQINIIVQC